MNNFNYQCQFKIFSKEREEANDFVVLPFETKSPSEIQNKGDYVYLDDESKGLYIVRDRFFHYHAKYATPDTPLTVTVNIILESVSMEKLKELESDI